jgi:hypothetical protein
MRHSVVIDEAVSCSLFVSNYETALFIIRSANHLFFFCPSLYIVMLRTTKKMTAARIARSMVRLKPPPSLFSSEGNVVSSGSIEEVSGTIASDVVVDSSVVSVVVGSMSSVVVVGDSTIGNCFVSTVSSDVVVLVVVVVVVVVVLFVVVVVVVVGRAFHLAIRERS